MLVAGGLMVVGWALYEPLGLLFSKDPAVIFSFNQIFFIVILV